jgi:hypothetical protein
MGPIAGIKSVAPPDSAASRGAPRSPAAPLPPGQLPAPAGSFASESQPVGQRPLAAFLTHLIATAHDAPQTRRKRRAAVSEALAAYAATTQRLDGGPAKSAMSGGTRAA